MADGIIQGTERVIGDIEPLLAVEAVGQAKGTILFVARDRVQAETLVTAIPFFKPDAKVILFPAWDCVPYDRVSPSTAIIQQRLYARWQLEQIQPNQQCWLIVPAAALMQKVGPAPRSFRLGVGASVDREQLLLWLSNHGYQRVDMVVGPGDFAVRGSLIDIFPSAAMHPVRLDWFGDILDTMSTIDVESQRSMDACPELTLLPMTEIILDAATQTRFLSRYREVFNVDFSDPMYVSIQQGRNYQGSEHLMPLFYENVLPLWESIPVSMVVVGHGVTEAVAAQWQQIQDHYQARQTVSTLAFTLEAPYYALSPDSLYMTPQEISTNLVKYNTHFLHDSKRPERFENPPSSAATPLMAIDWLKQQSEAAAIVIGCASHGRQSRARHMLEEAGLSVAADVATWSECKSVAAGTIALVPLAVNIAWSYREPGASLIIVVPDTLLFGAIEVSRGRASQKASLGIHDLNVGDLVVHADHGVGRYEGLIVLEVMGYPHDCLQVVYAGGDKLFVPVENIGILSRYGSETADLDKLGSTAWQHRKARVKNRLTEIAHHLMRIAAERKTHQGTIIEAGSDYTQFCHKFPYPETPDQQCAISDVMQDLASGRPMDRLVCGDVGFGKTEVAMRAAYAVASQGFQVAVVVPTTILCQQHYENFQERFQGTGVHIAALSRLVSDKQVRQVRSQLATGEVQIVVATHGILSDKTQWQNLGLVIIDEEHHFGVAQKEKLKELRSTVHVLTLTATPIPRTLQMALAGVRDLSLITTPPIDRLPVHTVGLIKDPLVIRDAILRERFRGGQVFYVCPRIEDLAVLEAEVRELVPEMRILTAHGQMPTAALEKAMHAFYTRQFDLLLCTNIIESGIDIPTANTMIVHRADMFGLSQLYQLRGRVGRAKVRGYAYLTVTAQAYQIPSVQKRLEVIQSLDYLGAGFALASHDMELRGAGNLVGKEQSGHIREVGTELYQQLLDEALEAVRSGEVAPTVENEVQINVGMPVMIPEAYVNSLSIRLQLYRRLGAVKTQAEIDTLAAEFVDRFGPLPDEVKNLLVIMTLKVMCRACSVQKLDAGPKGMVVTFAPQGAVDPLRLVAWVQKNPIARQIKPDQRLIIVEPWPDIQTRVAGIKRLLAEMAEAFGGQDHGVTH